MVSIGRITLIGCALATLLGCVFLIASKTEDPAAVPSPETSKPAAARVVVRILDYPKVPDLSSNPYPDAYATARVLPLETTGTDIPKHQPIIALFRVLNDRRRLAAADFNPSDVLGVTLTPRDAASEGTRSTQVLDTFFAPELPVYYVKTPTYLAGSSTFEAEEDEVVTAAEPPAVPVKASDAGPRKARLEADPEKQQRIASALQRIDAHLQREGGDWDRWQESLKGFRADLHATVHHKSHIDHKVRKSMELLTYDDPVANGIPAFDAVRQLADEVEAAGIDFVLYSIPSRIEVYPEWFSSEKGIAHRHVGATRLQFLKQVLEAGIEVIDAGDSLRTAKLEDDHQQLCWQGPDFHISPQGYEVLAKPLADYIRNRGILANDDFFSPGTLAVDHEQVAIHHTREFRMKARRILVEPDRSPIDPNRDSPVFLFGDSNLFWWQTNMSANCGLIGQLSYELKHFTDWQGRANLRPHHASDLGPERIANKKLWIQVQTAWVLWDETAPHQNVEPFPAPLPKTP